MTMHVRESGPPDAAPVLLLHGGGVGGWMWDRVVDRLQGDHRLLVPDLPGHDRSAAEDYVSHDRTVEELLQLLRDRAHGPVAVAGFSLGAQLAVLLAARAPELVDRVVVLSAQAIPTPAPGLTLALLGATAGLAKLQWFARLQAAELFVPAESFDDYLRTSRGISRRTLLAAVGENIRFTVPDGWSAYPGAALVMAGGRERGVMRASAERLAAAAGRGALEIVPDAGHGLPLQDPELVADRLRARPSA
ncbi:alpha/beta hydrolase [Agromyces mediolanus]|uniref:alpha/beta fold hydrolase n=1 Tax=Agromyces mediolanus TaxID=41986 RepID=UPI003832364A